MCVTAVTVKMTAMLFVVLRSRAIADFQARQNNVMQKNSYVSKRQGNSNFDID